MKISATIQARTGSQRLPNKVLSPILGRPMLALQVERIRRSSLIDEVIIATTTNPADDPIESLADELGVGCFRGSEANVLGRIVGALKHFHVELNVEFYGDSPLPDWTLIDTVIGFYLKQRDVDFVGTGLKTTFPPGSDVQVFPAHVLYDVDRRVTRPEAREYVSIHISSRADRYRVLNFEAPHWLRYPNLHLEVDTLEDFEVIKAIYEGLYPSNPCFLLPHVIDFIKQNPGLAERNRHVHRRWKVFRQEQDKDHHVSI